MKSFTNIEHIFKENQILIQSSINGNKSEVSHLSQNFINRMILIHTITTQKGLKCINSNDQECVFDLESFTSNQNVFKARYILTQKSKAIQKQIIVLFRFVIHSNQISVNFCIQNSSNLFQITINQSQQYSLIFEKYDKQLQKLLNQTKENSNQSSKINDNKNKNFNSLPFNYNQNNDQNNPNVPPYLPQINIPQQRPLNNPFGRDQYIGPNSNIFKNRFDQQKNNPNQIGKIPIGSRYDPVDPFDNMRAPQINPRQFYGFDQFGIPLKKPENFRGREFQNNNRNFGGFGGFGGFGNGNFGSNNFF